MKVDAIRKIGYSFIGLLAGNAAALMVQVLEMLFAFLNLHGFSRAWQVMSPEISFMTYVAIVFSSLGWALVGVPFVLLLPNRITKRLSWPFAVPIGMILGSLTLLVIIVLFFGVPTAPYGAFQYLSPYFMVATIISGVAFTVYCTLMRRALRSGEAENQSSDPAISVVKREIL